MAKKKTLKDTDYLFISTYLRSKERHLLTSARMERMIDAPSAGEAAKVLSEIGYGEFSAVTEAAVSEALSREQEKLFQDLYRFAPDRSVIDVFKVKYDYHNLKVLLKSRALGLEADRLLLDAGRVPAQELRKAVLEGGTGNLPEMLRKAAEEAMEVLSATKDPQLSDFVLDRAYYAEMLSAAADTGSRFLTDYVRAAIDAANLRGAVRTVRMRKGADLLKKVLVEGGAIAPAAVQAAALAGNLEALYRTTFLREAAERGSEAIRGGNLTAFEKACDDAVMHVAAGAKSVPFGVEAVISYLVAKEIEFTAVRVIMSGRIAGISGDTIRERLREAYV